MGGTPKPPTMATKVAVTSAIVDKKELASTPAPVAANNSDGDPATCTWTWVIRDGRDRPQDWFRTSIGPSAPIPLRDGPGSRPQAIDSQRSASRADSPWARGSVSGWPASMRRTVPEAARWRGSLVRAPRQAAPASRCQPAAPGLGSRLPPPNRRAVTAGAGAPRRRAGDSPSGTGRLTDRVALGASMQACPWPA